MKQTLPPDIDPLGHAINDYFNTKVNSNVIVESDLAEDDTIASTYFFRNASEMPEIETIALENCTGKILDIGAGAGSHSLILQERGFDVTSLEISQLCCEVMRKRGLLNVTEGDIFTYNKEKFDTLLFMMNGIGIAGTLQKLESLLQKCSQLLNKDGKIIFDSSDIDYMYYDDDGSKLINLNSNYYGELVYRMRYKRIKGNYFPWLFIDFNTLAPIARIFGYSPSILALGKHYDYLGVLHKNK